MCTTYLGKKCGFLCLDHIYAYTCMQTYILTQTQTTHHTITLKHKHRVSLNKNRPFSSLD